MMTNKFRNIVFLLCCVLILSGSRAFPQAAVPAPRDTPYPGTIRLSVNATDTDRRIFNVRETIPVSGGGSIVLLYPQWLPGNHSPTGRVDKLAGLVIRANGARLEWTRDPADVFAFHMETPAGTTALDLEFQFLSPTETDQGRVVVTNEMLNLQWNAVVLYPAGYFSRQITVEPSVRLPDGWQFATALETASTTAGVTTFKPVPLETLVDSPMFAGRYFNRLNLDAGGATPVRLNIVADRAGLLEVKPEQLAAHQALVQQAYKLYGSHHYDHYDFLLALTDRMGGIGLEHHQSSENATVPGYFTEWDKNADARDLLPHEYTHSWNGKFRRPADLWTPNYNVPMRDSLLWVYEGQTQYWGSVLTARSGMRTAAQTRDLIAGIAANFDISPGRKWRPLEDTTNQPTVSQRTPVTWVSWQRPEDYYTEGLLIWLDADTKIRELSDGKKSLDDFAKLFYGIDNGSFVTRTYTFDDLVAALNQVQAFDWATFLHKRVDELAPETPKYGITR